MAAQTLSDRSDPPRLNDVRRRHRRTPVIVAFLVGALLSGAIVYALVTPRPSDRVAVDVLSGRTTAVNSSGTAIGLAKESSGAGWIGGYDVTGATGRECLVPHSS